MAKSSFKLFLYRWHSRLGLASGVFLLVICVSGAIAVFRPEIERAFDWHGYDFRIAHADGAMITIDEALATAQAAFPGSRATAARRPALPGSMHAHGDTYSITLDRAAGANIEVLVDPYRNTVVRFAVPNRGWGNWLRQLHVRLIYGSFWGRWIVGGFGVVLLFFTISGLLIFTRFNGNTWRPRMRTDRGSRILLADVHKVVGLGSLVFNVIFGVSGAVLGLEGLYLKYFPKVPPRVPKVSAVDVLPAGGVEAFLQRATQFVPGSTATAATLAYRKTGTLKVELEPPISALVREHESYVIFNARTSEPLAVVDATKTSAAKRAFFALEPLHFGRLGGALWVKLLWAAMGSTGGLLSITGYAIYFLRQRAKVAKTSAAIVELPLARLGF